jgi:hypothetical protein
MPDFCEKVFKKYDAEPPIHISSCTLHCFLKTHECFSELGITDANDLANMAFTFPQIANALSRHRWGKEKESVLTYEGSNYFPIVVPGGAVEFVAACSICEFGRHKKWRAWFMGNAPDFEKGKILFKEVSI